MKVLVVVNDERNMIWQIHAYLENLKEIGWSSSTQVLIYCEGKKKDEWKIVQNIYPEVEFFFYQGDQFTKNIIPIYLPIIRPYTLRQHFRQNRELEKETIVYTDADILWVNKIDIDEYKEGCYVSSTVFPSDYQSHKYLLSKQNDVHPDKLHSYLKEIDIIKRLADICLITPDQIISNYENCGGVQYILNGVDWQFWEKVMIDCLSIRVELQNINQNYMKGNTLEERELNGFQSWCADLWSVFYNLLYRNFTVSAPKELDFAWATDKIERLKEVNIFHNAGVTSDACIRTTKLAGNGKNEIIDAPAFYKGKYTNITPFQNTKELTTIYKHPTSREYCTHYYTNHLIKLQNKYILNY